MILSNLSTQQLLIMAMCAVFIGMAKVGLSGVGLLIVPIMASAFGGKPSTGLVLPMLVVADVFAVIYYHRHTEWKFLRRLLPWAFAGIAAGMFTGDIISDAVFAGVLAYVIFIGIALVVIFDVFGRKIDIPHKKWFSALSGLAGGFTTMIGNAAGPVMNMYLLSVRLPKSEFIGTAAWFFFTVNLVKIPLHVFVWETITPQTLLVNLLMVVPIVIGVFVGIKIVKRIPEKWYRIFIILSTILASLVLLIK